MSSKNEGRTAKAQATRAQILSAALTLFNAHGTAAISTNRIAAEIGMSPGNLYYHFADKRQIIQALVADMIEAYGAEWSADEQPASPAHALGRLRESIDRGTRLAWQYRFFGREMVALLRADPELAELYESAYRERMAQWGAFGELLVAHGLLTPRSPLSDITAAVWLVAESWITFIEVTGDADDPTQVDRQLDVIFAVLEPHLTPEARELWKDGQDHVG